MVHVLLNSGLENFEHYSATVWDECNCVVVWTFFGIAFLWDWNEKWPFPVLCAPRGLHITRAFLDTHLANKGDGKSCEAKVVNRAGDKVRLFNWQWPRSLQNLLLRAEKGYLTDPRVQVGLLWWLSGKESACQCRQHVFDPWVRKIPWRRKWLPTPYSYLENSMARGAWRVIVHGFTKSGLDCTVWAQKVTNKARLA